MPRRREADAEDMLARCPHCRGANVVLDAARNKVTCPVCAGAGRVNQRIFLAYRSGSLDAEIAQALTVQPDAPEVQESPSGSRP